MATALTPNQPTTLDSVRRHVATLPLTTRIGLLQDIANDPELYELSDADATALDKALANLARAAISAEFEVAQHEDRHAFLFLRQPYGMAPVGGLGA